MVVSHCAVWFERGYNMLFSKGGNLNGTLFFKAWQADILLLFSDPNSPFDHSSQILFSKCQMHIIRHFCKWDCVRNLCHLVNDSFNIFGQVFSMLQLRQNVKNMRREKKWFRYLWQFECNILHLLPGHSSLVDCLSQIIYREKYIRFSICICEEGGANGLTMYCHQFLWSDSATMKMTIMV